MLKELRTQHRNIIQMAFSGFKNNEIAEKLEMSPSSVSQIIRSPLGQAYLEGLQDKAQQDTLDVRKKLISLNKGALDTFARILNPKEKAPHAVQLTAAKDVLDRNGYKPPDKLNIDMTMQAKSDAEIDAEIAAMEASISRMQSKLNQLEPPTNKDDSIIEDDSNFEIKELEEGETHKTTSTETSPLIIDAANSSSSSLPESPSHLDPFINTKIPTNIFQPDSIKEI